MGKELQDPSPSLLSNEKLMIDKGKDDLGMRICSQKWKRGEKTVLERCAETHKKVDRG